MLIAFVGLVASPASANTTPVIAGTSWMGGQGVNACGMNGAYDAVCGGDPAVGIPWQCVELAQRLYYRRGWYTAGGGYFSGVSYAYQIFDQASAMGMTAQANGVITSVVPGDMVVHTSADGGGAGHVAVVDRVSGNTVYAAEQNFNNTADIASYTLSGSTLSRGTMHIRGIVHSPNNPNTNATASAARMLVIDGQANAIAKDGLTDSWTPEAGPGVQAVAASGTGRIMVIDSSANAYSNDTLTANWILQFNGATAIAVGPTGRMMVTATNGYVYAKDNPGDNWITEAGPGVRAIAVGGSGRMMIIDGSGNAYSKDALTANWILQFTGARAVAVGTTGSLMVVRAGDGYAFAKDNPGDSWTLEAGPNVQAIAVGGNGRIAMVDGASNAYSKDTLVAAWVLQFNGATAVAIGSTGRLMVAGSTGYAYAKDNPGDNWITEAGPGVHSIAVG